MTIDEIRVANRASALEQQAQDERNAEAKADMMADELVNGHTPPRPQFFRDNEPGEELAEIVAENVKQQPWQS